MAKHLQSIQPLKGLLLAICLSILSALPAAATLPPVPEDTPPSPESIKVLQPSIVIPTRTYLCLSNLIENKVVEGVIGSDADYNIESSVNNRSVYIGYHNQNPSILLYGAMTTTVTYTHKEYSDLKFSIELTTEDGPSEYFIRNMGYIYLGKPKTITIPDSYLPLSDFSISKRAYASSPDADLNFSVEGNTILLEGVTEGEVELTFNHKYGPSSAPILVQSKPNVEDITINRDNFIIRTDVWHNISNYINEGAIEGMSVTGWQAYRPTSSDPNITCNDTHFLVKKPGVYTISYINQEFTDVTFDLTFTAYYSIASLLRNITVYEGQIKTIEIPNDYMPLTEYKSITLDGASKDIINLNVDEVNNTITIEGLKAGNTSIILSEYYFSDTRLPITVVAKPTFDEIKVLQPSITIPTLMSLYLNSLIENGVVEGIDGGNADYIIESSITNDVDVNNNYGYIFIRTPLTTTVTYTNKEFPEVKFSIEVTAKNSPAPFVNQNLGTLYVGKSKTITIPDDCLPLSEFTFRKGNANSNADFNYTVDGNQITLEGITEGEAYLFFIHKYGTCLTYTINIAKVATSDDIKVLEPSIVAPTNTSIRLSSLIQNSVVEGVPGSDSDYTIESSVTNNINIDNKYGSIYIYSPLTTTVTYINKEFPEVKFSIEVTAENSPARYVEQNLGSVYIGKSKTITIPDDYLPLSEFSLSKYNSSNDPNADFNFTVEGNEITLEGLTEGRAYLYFAHKFGTSSATINIAPLPAAEEIKVVKDPIMVHNGAKMQLSHLINAEYIEGIPSTDWQNYKPSSNSSYVTCGDNYFSISGTREPATITYTNTEFPEISFDITVVGKSYTGNLFSNLSVYIDQPNTITIPDEYMPLAEFKSIELTSNDGTDPNEIAKLDVDLTNNAITITGIKEGKINLKFTRRFGDGYQLPTINVLKKPTTDKFQVLKPEIELPIGVFVYLSDLVEKGYVEGIPSDYTNYSIEFSDPNIARSDRAGRFIVSKAGTIIVTFTHKEFPEISFPFEITARYNCPSQYIQSNLRTLYIGTSQTFTIPDDYLPLSDFDLSIYDSTNSPNSKFGYEVNGNEITLTGLTTGSACLQFDYKKVGTVQVLINVLNTPSAGAVKVLKKNIVIPTNLSIYPTYALLNGGVVEGITGSNSDFSVKSSDNSIVTCDSNNGYFRFTKPGTATITFTNKSFPEENFSIEVTAKTSLNQFTKSEIAYVGETKRIIVPEKYLSPSDYTFELIDDPNTPDTDCDISVNGNEILLTGVTEGKKSIKFTYRLGQTATWFSIPITIVKRSVAVKVNNDGEATAGSQIGVPINIELPDDIDLSTKEGESIVWESNDNSIAAVDPETGEITPKALGVTYITVKKVTETSSISRASANEETLVTIEFWVTELETPESIEIQPGTSKKLTFEVNAGSKTYPYEIDAEWTSSDPEVVAVNDEGVVTAVAEGSAVITLTTDIGTKEILVHVVAGMRDPFDINGDTKVNVSDVVSLVNMILNNSYDPTIHDLNNDTKVTVSDIVVLVNHILNSNGQKNLPSRSGATTEVPVSFGAMERFTAMQTDIVVADGVTIEDVVINPAIARSHSLAYNEIEPGRYRLIVYSAANRVMSLEADEPLFTLAVSGNDSVETEATVFVESEVIPTGIDSAPVGAEVESVTYFDIQGRHVSAEAKGILIERTVLTDGTVKTRKIRQ